MADRRLEMFPVTKTSAKNPVATPEVVVYFGLLLVLKEVGVAESEKRVAAIFLLPVLALEPPKRSFLPYSTTVFIFFDRLARESSFAGACTSMKNFRYCVLQRTKLSKNYV